MRELLAGAGPVVLLLFGAALVVCGGAACWCRLERAKDGRGCAKSASRW